MRRQRRRSAASSVAAVSRDASKVLIVLPGIPAFPALHEPFWVLGAPLSDRWLCSHHALHRCGVGIEQDALVPAGRRLRDNANSHYKFYHSRMPLVVWLRSLYAKLMPDRDRKGSPDPFPFISNELIWQSCGFQRHLHPFRVAADARSRGAWNQRRALGSCFRTILPVLSIVR